MPTVPTLALNVWGGKVDTVKTLIALDIDCVLMPWDDESQTVLDSPTRNVYDRFGKKTGFKDWNYNQNHSLRFLTFWSPEQHELIKQVGDVRWLTTWARDGLVEKYTEFTGFGPFPTFRPNQMYEAEYLHRWWKMGWMHLWLRENAELVSTYDRILWVDDDHNRPATMDGMAEIGYEAAQVGTEVIAIQPEGPVWSREEISLWLPAES